MVNHTIDAALAVQAARPFPLTFPIFFGPTATMFRSPGADASLDITLTNDAVLALVASIETPQQTVRATATGTATCHHFANASLPCTASFLSGTGNVWGVDASLDVTAIKTTTAARGAVVNASRHATAVLSSAVQAAWSANAPLAVTDDPTATARRHSVAHATLAITESAAAAFRQASLIEASMPVTVNRTANSSHAWTADANLIVSTYATFPYDFPFVFEQSSDTVGRGQFLTTGLDVTAAVSATGTRGAVVDVGQDVTATLSASALSGGEHSGDVSLEATATLSATMSLGQPIDALQAVEVDGFGSVLWDTSAQSLMEAEATGAAGAELHGRLDATQGVTASTAAAGSLSGLLDGNLTAMAAMTNTTTRNQFGEAPLGVAADTVTKVHRDAGISVTLAVQAVFEATFPAPTGFWNFYLR